MRYYLIIDPETLKVDTSLDAARAIEIERRIETDKGGCIYQVVQGNPLLVFDRNAGLMDLSIEKNPYSEEELLNYLNGWIYENEKEYQSP